MRRQLTAVLMAGVLGAVCIAMAGCKGEPAPAKEDADAAGGVKPGNGAAVREAEDGTAILVVSFGTSYNENRKVTIEAIEEAVAKRYGDCEVRRAFTSQIIIDKLRERDGLEIDSVEEALDRAAADGIALPPEELRQRALKWAMWQKHNGLSGRTARQFVNSLSREESEI